MEIRFVGSGDAFGSGGRYQTCIRLRADGYTALVDCGATSMTAMKAQQIDPGEIDAIVISHLHRDHFGGLPFLVLDGQFTRRTKTLTLLGPAGTANDEWMVSARAAAALARRSPGRRVGLAIPTVLALGADREETADRSPDWRPGCADCRSWPPWSVLCCSRPA